MFNTVLLAVDISAEATWSKALPTAQRLLDEGGTLHIVTVFPDITLVSAYFETGFESKAVAGLGQQQAAWIEAHAPGAVGHLKSGTIHAEIISVAREIKADAIVMASHKPGISDYVIGANAARVVSHAPHSVFVVRD